MANIENQDYYFTFGSSQELKDGTNLFHKYVRVSAQSYDQAREVFISCFMKVYAKIENAFAFQYDSNSWHGNADHVGGDKRRPVKENYKENAEYAHIKVSLEFS